MAIAIRKASRKKVKARIAISGPSGSGKTMSALLIAYGLVGDWNKVGIIDTEEGSGELYVGTHVKGLNVVIGEYAYARISSPFSADKYVDAIKAMESYGIEAIIIDSLSHAWSGEGGILDKHGKITDTSKSKNSYTAWRTITPQHNALVESMLQSKMHVIATMRSKVEYAQTKDETTGKTKIEKLGMASIQKEGIEYEFTIAFDIDIEHIAHTSKDRTTLFDGLYFKPSPETGKAYIEWANSGAAEINIPTLPPTPPKKEAEAIPVEVEEIREELGEVFEASMGTPAAEATKERIADQAQPAVPTVPPSPVAPTVPQTPTTPPPVTQEGDKLILPAQIKFIHTRINSLLVKPGRCDMETTKTCLHEEFKVASLKDLKASQVNDVLAWLNEFAKE